MKNKFSLILIFCFTYLFAQLDREHWFGPMIDRSRNPAQIQNLYISTNQDNPFNVEIYNNNILINTVEISKGNAQRVPIPRSMLITSDGQDVFTPITKGIYLKADFPFYANLRFSVFNHAEIITSKGTSSIGKNFHSVNAPILNPNTILNFMTSILATEDNTNITVSGYKENIRFSNSTTGFDNPTLNFKLNKGESYIIEGNGIFPENKDAFIGAKITSDKPINLTNGNFNGQYALNTSTASDIIMDQSVPIEKLGNEFVLVKGFGRIGTNTETPMIVAVNDNTQIFINDEKNPIATINTGEYFIIPDDKYINSSNQHFNMYIKTSKNVYLYQMLAGVDNGDLTNATLGFNFIPSLNCYLPKQIDELGFIDENFVYSSGNLDGILNIPTKLNVITEKGAEITINGLNPEPENGPFNVTGNNNWVTYEIPDIKGNLTINSSKAILAGINAGSNAVGYGGFFAGFATNPNVLQSGKGCVPNITLTVDPKIYDSYQWFRNDIPIKGANDSSYIPIQEGYYHCSVTLGSCDALITNDYKIQNCTFETSESYDICSEKNIQIKFSNSQKKADFNTIKIVNQPKLGTISIDSKTGIINYKANNPNVFAKDSFSYTFCSENADFIDCEIINVNINIQDFILEKQTLNACNNNEKGTFNLNLINPNINPNEVKFFKSLEDAKNENISNIINNPQNYIAENKDKVFALIKNNQNCKNIIEINLELIDSNSLLIKDNQNFCDDNSDGIINIDFQEITKNLFINPIITEKIRYYININDANSGNSNILPNNWTFSNSQTIYVRIDFPSGCNSIIKPLNFKSDKVNIIKSNLKLDICDDDLDGNKLIDLQSFITEFTDDSSVDVKYFETLENAQKNENQIKSESNFKGTSKTYIRIEKSGICPEIVSIEINIKTPKKSETLKDITICAGTTTSLFAGSGFDSYLWNNGTTTQTLENVSPGNYWVELTLNGCSYIQNVKVDWIAAIPIKQDNILDISCIDSSNNKTINLNDFNYLFVDSSSNYNFIFYENKSTEPINNPENYNYNSNRIINVIIKDKAGILCDRNVTINLELEQLITKEDTLFACNNDNLKQGYFDLTSANITDYKNHYFINYYESLKDLEQENNILIPTNYFSTEKTIYAQIITLDDCKEIVKINLKLNDVPELKKDTLTSCETPEEDPTKSIFNLKLANINSNGNQNVYFYSEYSETEIDKYIIFNPENYISETKKIYARVFDSNFCYNTTEIQLVANTKPEPLKNITICKGSTISLDAGSGFDSYKWNNGETSQIINNVKAGIYSVELKSGICIFVQQVEVKEFDEILIKDDILNSCSNLNNEKEGIFDLENAKVSETENITKKYYPSLKDLENKSNEIKNINNYISESSEVFVLIINENSCSKIAKITLNVIVPKKSETLKNITICKGSTTSLDAGSGFDSYKWNNGQTSQIINNVKIGTYSVELKLGNCTFVQQVEVKEASEILIKDDILNSCSNLNNEKEGIFDLENAKVSETKNITKKYYPSLKDLENKSNEIKNINNYVSESSEVFVLINYLNCEKITKIILNVNLTKKSETLKNITICKGSTTSLDAGSGFDSYKWNNGQTLQVIDNVKAGIYLVELKSGNCTFVQQVEVKEFDQPKLNSINIKDNGDLEVNVINGKSPYKYSLNGINWQDSNIFSNISHGKYILYIQDSNFCDIVQQTIEIYKLYNVISPNQDGINDLIDYSSLMNTKNNLNFNIYNRYGEQIFIGNNSNKFIWNGKDLNGRALPSTTYWYSINWIEPLTDIKVNYNNWIILKNQ